MNYKAIFLVYFLQLFVGVVWYSAAPADVTLKVDGDVSEGLTSGSVIAFSIALFCYTYFSAWLLVKANLRSGVDMCILTITGWLFTVIPNIFFISLFLDLSHVSIGYLLSFGFTSSVVAAAILPFWRANRTIFKG